MSVMVGGVTETLTADEAFVQGLNATVDDARVQVAYTLSFLVGLFQVRNSHPLVSAIPRVFWRLFVPLIPLA